MKELLQLNKYIIRYKWPLLLGLLCIISANILGVSIPYFIRILTDYCIESNGIKQSILSFEYASLFQHESFQRILLFVSILIGLALLKGIFMFFMRQGVIKISRKIEYDLKRDIFMHYLELSPSFYLKNFTGDLMSRISEDVSRAREYLGPAIMYTTNLAFTFTFVFYMMFSVNAKLSFLVLIPVPILVVLIYYVSRYINNQSTVIEQTLSKLSVSSQESFSGIRVIKSFAKENSFIHRFGQLGKLYQSENIKLIKVQSLFMPLMIGLIGLSNITVIYFGAKGVVNGSFSYGNIAEFIIYVNMLTWPVASLGWVTALVQRAAASQKRINEFMKAPIELSSGNQPVQFNHSIDLHKVSFRYANNQDFVLKNISLQIRKGDKIGFIGKTASGKSTLLHLIARLYDPTEGYLQMDDFPYPDINLNALRSTMAYVPQETFLFSDSIHNNVTLYQDNGPIDPVLKAAQVYQSFSNFADGLQTEIGERGVTLSGGQKQRLAIARGLYKLSDLLLFDDVFSALDSQTEQKIVKYLIEDNEKTILISTHRMSILPLLDKVGLIWEGRLIALEHINLLEKKYGYELNEILQSEQKKSPLSE